MTAPHAAAPPQGLTVPADAPEVLAEQVAVMQRNLPSMVLGNTLIPLVMVLALSGAVPASAWGTWLALQWLHSAFNAYGWWHTRGRRFSVRSAPRRARVAVGLSVVSGLLWALGVVWLWPAGRLDLQIFMTFLVGGVTSGALYALAALPKAYYVFLGPCVAAVLLMCGLGGTATHWLMAITVLAYGLTSLQYAANLNRTLVQTLRQRLELAALAEDLQLQKDRAEQAGVAKNRFLAAASHDLRQPVHALSLFMGALRDQPLPTEAAELVRHAASTVEGLSGLFNALLDVSRLDAGMVQPAPRRFAIAGLLQRVADGEGPVAAAKGLRLRVRLPRQGSAPTTVKTDPVLLERVLRNLVNNAVRYTERGGVLIALRSQGGMLRLQVWDTGIGIPPERQDEVFDEFVQLHNPQRDSRHGLGLGLAIVRRTAELLGVAVVLRSVSGRGSVFTLTLPSGNSGNAGGAHDTVPVPAAQPTVQPVAALKGRCVLVIDDDADVCAAMQVLLRGWGCEVLAAASVDELMPQWATQARVPDLIISDFRLRGTEDGPAAVARLRDEFNEDIPALLITGDTAPERLLEAQQSSLGLLHKPVAPEALVAAMVKALSVNADAHPDSRPMDLKA